MEKANELEVTWKRAIAVWWALCWRGILFAIGSAFAGGVIGGIIGFVVGFVCGTLGIPNETSLVIIKTLIFPVGLVAGIFVAAFVVRLVLRKKNFGDFRIALIPVNNEAAK
jgi:hypothetical protein